MQAQPDKHSGKTSAEHCASLVAAGRGLVQTQLMIAVMGVQGMHRLLPGILAAAFVVLGTLLHHFFPTTCTSSPLCLP